MYWIFRQSIPQLSVFSFLCLTLQLMAEEVVVVVSESAPVLVGNATIAEVKRGERFDVLQRSGPWVAIRIAGSDKTQKGWVFSNHLQSLVDPQQAPPTPTAVAPGIELQADKFQLASQGDRLSLAFRLQLGNSSQANMELDVDQFELAVGDKQFPKETGDSSLGMHYSNETIVFGLQPNGEVQSQWLQPEQLLSKRTVRPGEQVEGWLRFALPMLDANTDFSDLEVALKGQLGGESFALDLKEIAINQLDARLGKADLDPSVPVVSLHSELNALNIHSVEQLLDLNPGDRPQCVLRIHAGHFFVDQFVMAQLGGKQFGTGPQDNPYIFVLPEAAASSRYSSSGSYYVQSLRFARSEQEAALMILGEQAEKLPRLLTYLDHEEPEVRRTVVATLAMHSHLPQVSEHLIKAASDSDPSIRSTALMSLVGTSPTISFYRPRFHATETQKLAPEAIAVILERMEDMDESVRMSAAQVAAYANTPEIVQALIGRLNVDSQSVVFTACNSLVALKAESATEALEMLRQGEDLQTRSLAIRALGALSALTPLDTAIAQLTEGFPDYSDFQTLETVKDKRVVEPLIQYLARPLEHLQYIDQAAKILGDLGDPSATQVLLQHLKGANSYSAEVPRALGKLGDKSIIEELREVGKQPHIQQDREIAIYEALIRLEDETTLEHVLSRIATPDPQRPATHLLAVLGHSNSPLATLALSRQLDDPNNYPIATEALLRQATPRALRELERRLTAEDYLNGENLLNCIYHCSNPAKFEMLYVAQKSLNPQTHQAAENYMRGWAPDVRRHEHNELIGKDRVQLSVEEWAVGPALSNEQLQDKVVLLHFWALWCEPSRTTLKHLDAWQQQYADDGLVVVSLSAYDGHGWNSQTESSYRLSKRSKAEEFKAVAAFAEERGVKHAMGLIDSSQPWRAAYAVEGMPQLVLIDRDGKIRTIRVGNVEEPQQVEALLTTALRERNLDNRVVTQASLDGLVRLPLHVLNLQRAKLNTDTLQLPPLDALTTLHVDGMELDNRSFASLLGDKEWPNIRTLTLSGTQLDDRALERLAAFPALDALAIGCEGITDQGMQALTQCASLKNLSLGDQWGHAPVTAEGLMQLVELKSLETLELNGMQLTDEALFAIEKIAGLRSLEMLGTGISMKGIERLQQARPEVEVVIDRWTDWLSHAEFQQRFGVLAQQGFLPLEIESEMREGEERYRARFMPRPDERFIFTATHGNSEQQYAMYESMAAFHSYKRMSLSVLQTPAGEKKYSGTWVQQPYPAYWKTIVDEQIAR